MPSSNRRTFTLGAAAVAAALVLPVSVEWGALAGTAAAEGGVVRLTSACARIPGCEPAPYETCSSNHGDPFDVFHGMRPR